MRRGNTRSSKFVWSLWCLVKIFSMVGIYYGVMMLTTWGYYNLTKQPMHPETWKDTLYFTIAIVGFDYATDYYTVKEDFTEAQIRWRENGP